MEVEMWFILKGFAECQLNHGLKYLLGRLGKQPT